MAIAIVHGRTRNHLCKELVVEDFTAALVGRYGKSRSGMIRRGERTNQGCHMRFRAVLVVFSLSVPGTCFAGDGLPSCSQHDLSHACTCNIETLHPTQVSVGFLRVEDILGDPSKLGQHARDKPTKVVVGPDAGLYIIDGHHHARAMLEQSRRDHGPATTICQIVADDSAFQPSERTAFLRWLAAHGQARLNGGDDVNGEIRPDLYPPETLDGLTDDSYRSLANFMEAGCDFKSEGDYAEFRLADLLRHAQIRPPTELNNKKKQGRQAAKDLVAGLGTEALQHEFIDIPDHDAIAACASDH